MLRDGAPSRQVSIFQAWCLACQMKIVHFQKSITATSIDLAKYSQLSEVCPKKNEDDSSRLRCPHPTGNGSVL